MQNIFVIGASGYVGSHIARALQAQGISVTGMSRSEAADEKLQAAGIRPVRGSVTDLEQMRQAAAESDGVVYAAGYVPEEADALRALVDALAGSDRPLAFTSGASLVAEETAGHASPRRFAEDSVLNPPRAAAARIACEDAVRAGAERGVRGIVIRPPMVYGDAGSTKIPMMANCGVTTGVVRYVGPGENHWGIIHIDDLAELFVRALAKGTAGATYHSVAGEITFKELAEAIGKAVGRPAGSWDLPDAEAGYGKFNARVSLGSSCRPTGELTAAALGWRPTRTDIVEDVVSGSYKAAWVKSGLIPA